MVEDLVGTYGSRLLVAVAGVGIALVCLVFALRFLRNRAPSPFLRGGRNRQPRLQVLDAAAVDARRRLVLVRRDDVEHLIMIGGPTDVVIESRIRSGEMAADRDDDDHDADRYYAADDDDFIEDADIAEADDDDGGPARDRSPSHGAGMAATPARTVTASPAAVGATTASDWRPRHETMPASDDSRQRAFDLGTETGAALPVRSAAVTTDPLEAARQRMLAMQRDEPPTAQPALRPAVAQRPATPPPVTPAAAAMTEKHNDFERLLEQEMASRLEANRVATPRGAAPPRPVTALQAPSRAQAQPAAEREQKSMQQEMARIFGEGKRDD